MSKHETPLTRRYWEEVGEPSLRNSLLSFVELEMPSVFLMGLIIQGEPKVIAEATEVTIKGKNIIFLQTKANRLGMNLMGQAIIFKKLMERF